MKKSLIVKQAKIVHDYFRWQGFSMFLSMPALEATIQSIVSILVNMFERIPMVHLKPMWAGHEGYPISSK